jgi:hypothetical protein
MKKFKKNKLFSKTFKAKAMRILGENPLNIKIFLNYLVHQKYLTPSQIKTTLPQTTEAKVLLNALVKQGYFSSEELKNHLKNFKEQHPLLPFVCLKK